MLIVRRPSSAPRPFLFYRNFVARRPLHYFLGVAVGGMLDSKEVLLLQVILCSERDGELKLQSTYP